MKNKFFSLLLVILFFFYSINSIKAEEEYNTEDYNNTEENYQEEDIKDEEELINEEYAKTIEACRKKDAEEIVSCCASILKEDMYDTCISSAFNKCISKDGLIMRKQCCMDSFQDETIQNKCKLHSEQYCSPSDSVKMNKLAMNVKVGYEPYEEKDPELPDITIYMLDIKVYNVTPELILVLTSEDGTAIAHYEDSNNGVVTFRNTDTTKVKSYKLDILSNDVCMRSTLRTVNITLPKYNIYSEREICTEVPSYYLCQPYITYDVDSERFLEDVKSYKNKTLTKQIENDDNNKGNKKITTNIVNNISKNKYLTVGIIIAIGLIITIIIVIRHKKKEDDDDDEDL